MNVSELIWLVGPPDVGKHRLQLAAFTVTVSVCPNSIQIMKSGGFLQAIFQHFLTF